MKVIYTKNIPSDRDPEACYRTEFLGVIAVATEVVVDGDFAQAEKLYKNAGVKVSKPLRSKTKADNATTE